MQYKLTFLFDVTLREQIGNKKGWMWGKSKQSYMSYFEEEQTETHTAPVITNWLGQMSRH